MSPKLKAWLISLANAVISALVAGLGSLAAGVSLKQGLIIVTISAGGSLGKWLVQHPIPGGTEAQ